MEPSRSKRAAAMSSIVASLLLTAAKLAAGLLTGSLGLLSEAAHSLLDLGAAGLTYFAVSVSDRPADEGHPFGHGKIEAVSALIETGLLFLTSVLILREAVMRLLSPEVAVVTTWYSVAVMVLSIVVDFGRSRVLMRVAKQTRSQALEADALHFTSDILSSAVVLVGLGCVALGYPKGDSIAAIGVSLFVLHIGYGLGKRTIDVLVDAAPEGIADIVRERALAIPGVARVEQIKARPAGSIVFVDVLIRVGRGMALDRAKEVCDAVAVAIHERLPESSPVVRAEPVALSTESIIDTVRLTAAKRGLLVHDVGVYHLSGRKHVSFDVEVDATLDFKEAHAIATGIEGAVRTELGGDVEVVTHIDPRRFDVIEGLAVDEAVQRRLATEIEAIARGVSSIEEVHDISLQQAEEGYYVALHCLFAPTMPVRAVHDATVELENRLRQDLPGIGRVVVHAEPQGYEDP